MAKVFHQVAEDREVCFAFPAEAAKEKVFEKGAIDDPGEEPVTVLPGTMHTDAAYKEAEFLDRLSWPGIPENVKACRKA